MHFLSPSYVSESREKLESEQIQAISSSKERESIEKLLTDTYNWFDEDGWEADEATLKKKLKALKEAMKVSIKQWFSS